MKKIILMLLAMVLSGCATTVPMPKEDTLDYLRVTENNITVMSDKYGYVFKRDKTRDVYNDYKAFYDEFGDKSPGVAVYFVVKDKDVTAEYRAIVDATQLTSAQKDRLKYHYNAHVMESGKTMVAVFKAKGTYDGSLHYSTADATRLDPPVTVSITDKTEQNVSYMAPLMIPIFPLVMMYGCAKGPCV
ncbi:hypothetical protein K3G69_02470 [Phytobacter diazotrophicus]|jgi:nucleoside diphosphate kinase|uniref:hypothetical protein n=1 Tax=Phytobacter diazotrophicus TaxID=395631 RepID=UPI000D164445|nr:hypothetical protein [Phytobacter diazotrophicus]MBY6255372.1 hypothetical protein [Phytobacter diazotrophicus]MDU7130393.1 hypothetical protein [Enterobacteriaceae bacterium]MDV2903993.1 hypothetical protein [Phytobacter diazotrophicus]PTA94923.1 hypothetical protein C9415_13445 [Kluyvera sp. Nf5]